jgi:hypothetical protein
LSTKAKPKGPELGRRVLGAATECGGTSSWVPVLPSMISTSLLYGLSGPVRS